MCRVLMKPLTERSCSLLTCFNLGKGYEDKRGQPITADLYEKSWLYVNNHPVVCTRHMEVAAVVSAMNPHINATTDSQDLGRLQQASHIIFLVMVCTLVHTELGDNWAMKI